MFDLDFAKYLDNILWLAKSLWESWPIVVIMIFAALFRELSEHSKESSWSENLHPKLRNYLNSNGKKGGWRNKWKKDQEGFLIPAQKSPWYYFGLVQPEYKERFMYSSTIFVFITDGEHLFQFFNEQCIFIALGVSTGSFPMYLSGYIGFKLFGLIKEIFLPKLL